MDIFAKLKELIAEQTRKKKDKKGIDVENITPETALKDLGLDSLDTAVLLINIETEFKLAQTTQEEMVNVKTIQDAMDLIEKKRGQ